MNDETKARVISLRAKTCVTGKDILDAAAGAQNNKTATSNHTDATGSTDCGASTQKADEKHGLHKHT